jgi:hypothetical protein
MGGFSDEYETNLFSVAPEELEDVVNDLEDTLLEVKAFRSTVTRPAATGNGNGLLASVAGAKKISDAERKLLYEASVRATQGVVTSCPWCLLPMTKKRATFCKKKCKDRFHNWRRAFASFESVEILDSDEALVELWGIGKRVHLR